MGFGLSSDAQVAELEEFWRLISPERDASEFGLLGGLFKYLKCEDNRITHLLTHLLKQDDLERFFGIIRLAGRGGNDHPSRTEFIYRLKGLLLTRTDDMQRIRIDSSVECGEPGWIRLSIKDSDTDQLLDDDLEDELDGLTRLLKQTF